MPNIKQNVQVCDPSIPQGKLHKDDSSNVAW
jgi:hypothetical protein